jgi:glycosyltransferase involved in cell wall biosynthesis
MKLGVVTHYMPPHPGGIEHVAEVLFRGYTAAGLDVRWLASRTPANAPAREPHRIRVPCWNGLENLVDLPMPIWSPTGWRELAGLVRWADVLQVHDCLYLSSAVAVALGRRAGLPVVLSQHVGFVRYASPVLNSIERVAYATLGRTTLRKASRVVFATPAAVRHVTELLALPPERTCTIPNGIDLARFRPGTVVEARKARVTLGWPHDRPVVLFVGRLVAKKGIDLVLAISERLPKSHFAIIGDGPLRGLVRIPRPNVSWIPGIAAARMPECFGACDSVLLPSRDEGLPVVVQEALASGRPAVISEEEPYAGELIAAGVCAGAPRSAEAMAASVTSLTESVSHEMSARARAYAEAHWDQATMVRRYIEVLVDVVSANGRPINELG